MQDQDNSSNEWGKGSETNITIQDKKHAHERFNRWFDLDIALFYFLVIFDVKLWQPSSVSQDILALVTPVVFYLLGMNSSKGK